MGNVVFALLGVAGCRQAEEAGLIFLAGAGRTFPLGVAI